MMHWKPTKKEQEHRKMVVLQYILRCNGRALLLLEKKRTLALGRRRKLQAAWLSLQWLQYSTPTQFLLSGVYWI
jgi:hypothetical protein